MKPPDNRDEGKDDATVAEMLHVLRRIPRKEADRIVSRLTRHNSELTSARMLALTDAGRECAAEFWAPIHLRVFRIASDYMRSKNVPDFEDLGLETAARVMKRWEPWHWIDEECRFNCIRSFTLFVASGEYKRWYQKYKKSPVQWPDQITEDDLERIHKVAGDGPSVSSGLETREKYRLLRDAVTGITDDRVRFVLQAYYLEPERKTFQNIAENLGISVGSVHAALHKGLAWLRSRLGDAIG